MIHTIKAALGKDKQARFLVQLDFEGYKKNLATDGCSLGKFVFDGVIADRQPVVSTSLSLTTMRFSDVVASFHMANKQRFQDLEQGRRLDLGVGSVYLHCDSLAWSDISAHPIFKGSFRKQSHTKSQYAFDLVDYSNTMGKTVVSISDVNGSPAENIEALLRSYTYLKAEDIDVVSLGTLERVFGGWNFSTSVNSRTNTMQVIDRLLLQCMCGRKMSNGKFAVVVFDPDAPVLHRLGQNDVKGGAVQVDSTPHDQVVNDVYVEYNQSGGAFGNNFTVDWTNNAVCKKSWRDYGPRPQARLALADVAEETTARACVARFLQWRAFRHDIVRCRAPHFVGFDMMEGDVAALTLEEGPSLDGLGWQDEPFILLDRSINLDDIGQRWWRIDTD